MSYPKVLVGCPTFRGKNYCLKEYADRVKSLSYDRYDVLLVDNSEKDGYCENIKAFGLDCVRDGFVSGVKKRLAKSRNVLRKEVLDGGYDYFLSLEQDVIPPVDVIERLLACNKPVVSAVYTRLITVVKGDEIVAREQIPVLYGATPENKVALLPMQAIQGQGVIRIYGGGLGCLLIHRFVLESIMFQIGDPAKGCDDMYFFTDLQAHKIPAFAHTEVLCAHREQKWSAEVKKS